MRQPLHVQICIIASNICQRYTCYCGCRSLGMFGTHNPTESGERHARVPKLCSSLKLAYVVEYMHSVPGCLGNLPCQLSCPQLQSKQVEDSHISQARPAHTANCIVDEKCQEHCHAHSEKHDSRKHCIRYEIIIVRIPLLIHPVHPCLCCCISICLQNSVSL